jgi:hypothetical protein
VRTLGKLQSICLAVWVVCAGQLAAQEAPLPPPRVPRPEEVARPAEVPQPPSPREGQGEGTIPAAIVSNSGYAGADSQWDQMHYIGESPTYQDPAGCIGGGCRDSEFTPFASTSQGVSLLNRNRARGTLSTDVLPVLGRHPVFSSGDLPFQIAPAYDEVVEAYLGRDANNYDWFVQGGFRGFSDWMAEGFIDSVSRVTEVTPQGTITHGGLNSFFNGDFVGLDWVDRHTARYGSEFNTGELNIVLRPHPRSDRMVLYPNGQWQRECQPGTYWSFLAGVRYFNVDEGFTFRGAGFFTQDVGGTITQGLLSGTYFAHTHNDLIGLQFGTEVTYRDRGWELGFHFKAAPMINTSLAKSQVDTSDPIFGDQHVSYRFADTNVAALLELGVLGTYRLNDGWAIRGGYDISWLTGVAFAPVQRPSANQVNVGGTVFFQGLTLGMEYRR